MRADLLHVITAIANPIRWKSRMKLYRDFEQHILDAGAKLTVVECTYGDRPYELGGNPHVQHIGVRASGHNMVWNKECLLNMGIQRNPEAKYFGTFDADIQFRRGDFAAEIVHALQHYHVLQPWSDCYDLGPNGEHMATHRSFARMWHERKPIMQGPNYKSDTQHQFAHPGYAWAWTRQALEWTGGLMHTAALGAADHHMALAMLGRVGDSIPTDLPEAYKAPLRQWQARACRHMQGSLGYIAGTIEHYWHGAKDKRAYIDRWSILRKWGFDPVSDLKTNSHGVVELAGNKPGLAHDIDVYFRSRDEDSNTLG